MKDYKFLKCGDEFRICSSNSDAKCFRIRAGYSFSLVQKKPETCDNCPYNRILKELVSNTP